MIWLHFEKDHSGCFERRETVGRQECKAQDQLHSSCIAQESNDASLDYDDSGEGGEKQLESWCIKKIELIGFFLLWMWVVRERVEDDILDKLQANVHFHNQKTVTNGPSWNALQFSMRFNVCFLI